MEIQYCDYTRDYKNQLIYLENFQWGEGSDSDYHTNIDKYIIKLAVVDNKAIGCCVSHKEKDYFYIDMITILPEFQKFRIGTHFLKDAINCAMSNGYNRVECVAIEAKNHVNSQKLLENFGFKRTESIEKYWGRLLPNFYCKECEHSPCICTMHHYVKDL